MTILYIFGFKFLVSEAKDIVMSHKSLNYMIGPIPLASNGVIICRMVIILCLNFTQIDLCLTSMCINI